MDLCGRQASWQKRICDHNVSNGCGQGGGKNLGRLKIILDREASTLTVWFADPQDEHICEETGDDVVLMKDKDGHVIGFERLSYHIPQQEILHVDLETV